MSLSVNAWKLRVKSAATTSSSRQHAICTATSVLPTSRPRRPPSPTAPRPSCLSASATATRVPRNAGNTPQPRPVNADTNNENPSTRQSRLVLRSSGTDDEPTLTISASSASRAQTANVMPTSPPATASTRLSASNWRTRRIRRAPIDWRIAISRERPAARASSRPATLPHAMARRTPTIASRIRNPRVRCAERQRRAEEARSRDADHGDVRAVDRQGAADGVGRRVEAPSPATVADDRDGMAAERDVVGRREQTSHLCLLAQRREVLA